MQLGHQVKVLFIAKRVQEPYDIGVVEVLQEIDFNRDFLGLFDLDPIDDLGLYHEFHGDL